MTYFTADYIYADNQLLKDHYVELKQGVIRSVAPLSSLDPRAFRDMIAFEDACMVPGFVNSHTHSFQSLLKGFCDDRPFFEWREYALYKYGASLSPEGIYVGALMAFSEMLKQGITTVCDFFYLNDQGNDNAKAVIRAAEDVGIRLVMARCLYDWDGAPTRFRETIDQAVSNTEALMAEMQPHPMVSVLPAPHSLHGASIDMIRAGAEIAQRHQVPFHMHIAEARYERDMVQEQHGKPPIKLLDKLGLLNEHLVGVHCVWLDRTELKLMADRKAGVAYNPSSNMFLGDGVAKISEMLALNIPVSLGTDGGCSNNRASIVEEMRMTSLLQKVTHCDPTQTPAETMLTLGTVNGGRNLKLPVGRLAPGHLGDFVVVDLDDLSVQPRQNVVKHLVYSMQPSAIRSVFVGGRKVYDLGELLHIPEQQVVEKVRA
ncbi:MAG: amidohydrolase, partial [Candidatus Melainabacteria bacterium]|nr:amidohydrolase [Candidatus Melainabacteria bacterium]